MEKPIIKRFYGVVGPTKSKITFKGEPYKLFQVRIQTMNRESNGSKRERKSGL